MKNLILLICFLLMAVQGMAQDQGPKEKIYLKDIQQVSLQNPQSGTVKVQTLFLINVLNQGCTEVQNFKVDVDDQNDQVNVKIKRVGEDLCKGFFPEGIDLVIQTDRIRPDQKIQLVGENIINEMERTLNL